MTTDITAAQLLAKAADHMLKVGKGIGAFTADPDKPTTSPVCVIGAIRIAGWLAGLRVDLDQEHEAQPKVVREAEDWAAERVNRVSGRLCTDKEGFVDPVETVTGWNDELDCDLDSAVDLLREAAADAAAQELVDDISWLIAYAAERDTRRSAA